eukprot:6209773-Pleurochrysis_carterae.AAC.3
MHKDALLLLRAGWTSPGSLRHRRDVRGWRASRALQRRRSLRFRDHKLDRCLPKLATCTVEWQVRGSSLVVVPSAVPCACARSRVFHRLCLGMRLVHLRSEKRGGRHLRSVRNADVTMRISFRVRY